MQRLCVRARARGGGGQERARSGPGSSPGFAGRRRRGEAALSLLASGSQACGSVGPAAGAEGARAGERLHPPAAGGAPRGHRLPPPGATERQGPAPSRGVRQGLLLFSKCISRPEPPPAPARGPEFAGPALKEDEAHRLSSYC